MVVWLVVWLVVGGGWWVYICTHNPLRVHGQSGIYISRAKYILKESTYIYAVGTVLHSRYLCIYSYSTPARSPPTYRYLGRSILHSSPWFCISLLPAVLQAWVSESLFFYIYIDSLHIYVCTCKLYILCIYIYLIHVLYIGYIQYMYTVLYIVRPFTFAATR